MDVSPRALRGIELPERYELLHHIADGGMAGVWRTRDRVLERDVAIKLLSRAYAHDHDAVRRFEREARAAARVSDHRHVVTIYDVGSLPSEEPSADPVPFIAMEYLPGGSVHQALADGPVEPHTALRWLRETASALDHAHSHGIVHRDIKPANLLLDGNGSVHVADFGIARIAAEASITATGQVLGTASYLPPEQAVGGPATPDGDRYSLAVVAYELLTGTRPFDGDRRAALADPRVVAHVPPASARNPSLPAAVDGVLARGLARVPTDRWPSGAEFVRRLERALAVPVAGDLPTEPAPTEPAPTGPFVPYATRGRRRPPAWAAALAATAAIALGAGIATGGSSGESAKSPNKPVPALGAHIHKGASKRQHAGSAVSAQSAPATPTTPPATSTAPVSAGPAQLDAQAHAMMLAGNYADAMAALRQVLAGTPPDSLLHAYALFDLGHSLRLSGDPQAAIPVLEQRLRYPNQTGVVRAELALAERAAGLAPAAAPEQPGKGHHGHGHGPAPGPGGPGSGGGSAAGD